MKCIGDAVAALIAIGPHGTVVRRRGSAANANG